jgi:hypothetical protein
MEWWGISALGQVVEPIWRCWRMQHTLSSLKPNSSVPLQQVRSAFDTSIRPRVTWPALPRRYASQIFWGFSLVFALNLLQLGRPLVPERPWLPYDLLRWVIIPLPLVWLWLVGDLLPRRMHPLLRRTRQVAIVIALLLAIVTALIGPWTHLFGLEPEAWAWLFYPLYLFVVAVTLGPALWLARKATTLTRVPAHRAALRAFTLATALILLATLYRIGGFWGRQDLNSLPILPGDAMLVVAVIALGAALVLRRIGEGETNAPAFVYSLANAAAITLLYTLVVSGVALLLKLSWVLLVAVVPLAVATHWLTDWSRGLFDSFFYRAPVQRLRADLRTLIRALDRDEALEPQVRPALARLTSQVRAPAAALVLLDAQAPEAARLVATYPPSAEVPSLAPASLRLHASAPIPLPPPLQMETGPAWGVPLLGAAGQVGTLIVWSAPSRGFSDLSLALLDEVGAQLAPLLVAWEAQNHRLNEIEGLVTTYREQVEAFQAQVQTLASEQQAEPELDELATEARAWVEEALRNLHNVAYLGQHPLAQTRIIAVRVAQHGTTPVTHLERGQAVRQLCEELIERLRPPGPPPAEPHPPEWRLYTVLHAAYIEGEPNREIMSRLYIGEGTFHRARRQALASLAEAFIELERVARSD